MEKHWIIWFGYFGFLVHIAIQGFEGPNCTLDLNECHSGPVDPCGHRGRCNNTVGSYECQCLDGWSGTHCENRNRTSELNVTCIPGYYGKRCSETHCGNGYPDPDFTVTSSVLSISVCIGKDGWNKSKTDAPCNVDIDECMQTPTICSNGGNCTNTNGSYHCECTEHWEGINCSDYVTTTTEAITTAQTTETFTNETITARQPTTTVIYVKDHINQNTIEHTEETTTDHPQLKSTRAQSTEETTSTLTWQSTQLAKAETPQDITELTTAVLNVTDPTNHKPKEPTEQTITEHEQLKWTGAISTDQTAINFTQQTSKVAKTEATQDINEMTTTVLYVKDPKNQTTVEYTEETTTDHRHTSAPDLLSTQTDGTNNTTADFSSSVTDSASTEVQRRPFLSNLTTLELTMGPSLTRLLSDSENEHKDKLKAWMIALIAVVVVLACVLIAALLVLKYYTVANKTIRKRMTNRVDVPLASMENNWNFKANERMQRGSISGV